MSDSSLELLGSRDGGIIGIGYNVDDSDPVQFKHLFEVDESSLVPVDVFERRSVVGTILLVGKAKASSAETSMSNKTRSRNYPITLEESTPLLSGVRVSSDVKEDCASDRIQDSVGFVSKLHVWWELGGMEGPRVHRDLKLKRSTGFHVLSYDHVLFEDGETNDRIEELVLVSSIEVTSSDEL